MSLSESPAPGQEPRAAHSVRDLVAHLDELTAQGRVDEFAEDDLRALVGCAARAHAAASEAAGYELPVADARMATTEAVVLACALLRAQELTPFDLALWFSRSGGQSR